MDLAIVLLGALFGLSILYVLIAGAILFILLRMYESDNDYSIQKMSIKDLESISFMWVYHLFRMIIYGPFYLIKRCLQ